MVMVSLVGQPPPPGIVHEVRECDEMHFISVYTYILPYHPSPDTSIGVACSYAIALREAFARERRRNLGSRIRMEGGSMCGVDGAGATTNWEYYKDIPAPSTALVI